VRKTFGLDVLLTCTRLWSMGVVSVTELNQQTAKVLERVKNGESLEVNEHGRRIARIVPAYPNASVLEQLVSEGRAVLATNTDALFAPVPAASPNAQVLSEALQNARDAERF
jgi:prevent-host-death family protein